MATFHLSILSPTSGRDSCSNKTLPGASLQLCHSTGNARAAAQPAQHSYCSWRHANNSNDLISCPPTWLQSAR